MKKILGTNEPFKVRSNALILTVVLCMIFGLAAAGTAGGLQKIGKLEKVVDIVAWPGYIERGDTDPSAF